jgi:hypothetical protein
VIKERGRVTTKNELGMRNLGSISFEDIVISLCVFMKVWMREFYYEAGVCLV